MNNNNRSGNARQEVRFGVGEVGEEIEAAWSSLGFPRSSWLLSKGRWTWGNRGRGRGWVGELAVGTMLVEQEGSRSSGTGEPVRVASRERWS